ncbi:hypothetical protein BHE74_00033325 [Ensete ventricosum]|nr:hypothetical protein BHE74_00033325 [Ensete ventricosum]
MHSFAVDAVAGYRLQRAVAERLAGQVADDSVTTLHLLAIAPVTSVTTHAFRALLERLHQHAAVGGDVHVADRSVLDGRESCLLEKTTGSSSKAETKAALKNKKLQYADGPN